MDLSAISPAVLQILASRQITQAEDIEEFLSSRPKRTYDPFLMKGMEEAVDMILAYAEDGKKICIYGDYDADGVTSVSLMLTILGELTEHTDYYIPSRFTEGYGLNKEAIDLIAQRGTDLIITVDNGCVACSEIAYIKEKGMEVIVTDHHNVEAKIPDCIMLNPKQPGDQYPFAYLCGCGIAFKLAQALTRRAGIPKAKMNALLDMVGIATIGDVVPLVDENRTLVKYGMDRIRRNERLGLQGLLQEIQLRPEKLSSYNIAFGVVPHINSCGRMEHASMGVQLLTAKDTEKIRELSEKMAALNQLRKKTQEEIYDAGVAWVEEQPGVPDFLLYYAGDAHEGVTGIVAGKLKDRYYRPAVILTDSGEGMVKGTGRSIPGVDLHRLLSRYGHLFARFGGHAGACGFSMDKEHMGLLDRGLQADMQELLQEEPDLLTKKLVSDAVIDADEVSLALARDVQRMEPFGEGNPRPLFLIRNTGIRSVQRMGSAGQYCRLRCISAGGNTFEAVCFDDSLKEIDEIRPGDLVDLYGEIDENVFNGRSSVQVILQGVRFHS